MSASTSARRGGQPSTTQPIAGPWLSPQVVTRNRWPKLLWLMPPLYAAAAAGGRSAVGAVAGVRRPFPGELWQIKAEQVDRAPGRVVDQRRHAGGPAVERRDRRGDDGPALGRRDHGAQMAEM